MIARLKLMCVLAHPDDEAMGMGALLAKCAAEGVETAVVTATLGQRGWSGAPDENPGPEELGRIRGEELRCAAAVLGVSELTLLGYMDGELDRADPTEATARIVAALRAFRPQVVVTFGPDGGYGHPDHVAISQFTTAAVAVCADPTYAPGAAPPHRVAKLYYMADTQEVAQVFREVGWELTMHVDGVTRRLVVWEEWMISARVDAGELWPQVWAAVACHRSQLPNFAEIEAWPPELHRRAWGCNTFYRALSLVNGGRAREDDLFAGLRDL
jgi:LmbE family N-acetylglucosaminyl deacetylase